MKDKTDMIYITTPIYYVNAEPHLGHAYTSIVADVFTRFNRLAGKETYFLTGTDEHGDKIVKAAEKNNETPQKYADRISNKFESLWPRLNISNNDFIRTTEERHKKVVIEILQKIYDKGDIYFSEYGGLYCYGCERFYLERELIDNKCPDHKTEPAFISEKNYFFRMSKYQDWLVDHIKKNSDFIRPERYKNEVLSFLKEPLDDLCISRPKSRLTWGITLPFDDQFVTYVWFDALINYLSAIGYPDNKLMRFWPHVNHIIAKDILKPHAIYWPTMLKAAGIRTYRSLNVHGFWNVEDNKMSKSLGNVIKPLDMIDTYGVDAFRFFLLRDMVFGLDSSFNETSLINRINSDLANDIGNLFSRTVSMLKKFCNSEVPASYKLMEEDINIIKQANKTCENYCKEMSEMSFHKGLISIWKLIGSANRYIVETEPWALAKSEDKRPRLNTVMNTLMECLRVIAVLINPIMPETSEKMFSQMGLDASYLNIEKAFLWDQIPAGTIAKIKEPLFPRVKDDKPVKNKN